MVVKKKIIYVAGPYSGKDENAVFENIITARKHALELWRKGWIVICPHTNSLFMGGAGLPDKEFVDRDLEIVSRCDAIYMLPGWEKSEGAIRELTEAKKDGLEIYYAENVGVA